MHHSKVSQKSTDTPKELEKNVLNEKDLNEFEYFYIIDLCLRFSMPISVSLA